MTTCKRLAFKLAPFVAAAFTFLALLLVNSTSSLPAEEAAAPLAKEAVAATPLKIGYSDWPGWLVLEIAKQKGFFKDAGVDVELEWFDDYGKSIEAYTAGKLDGIMIACNDSLTAKSSVIIVLTDFSEGNDMIIGKKGIDSIKDLKGKTVGLEKELVEHLLLVTALEKNGLKEEDVKIDNVKTEETTQALKGGKVDAIGAWYPRSGLTLQEVADSKALFTSKEAPGLIYDALQVDPASLDKRRDEWKKVVGVWFRCLEYLNDPKTHDDAVKIMSQPIKGKPADLEKNLKGTHLLDGAGNLKAMQKKNSLDSIYGSLNNADKFYQKHVKDYKSPNTDKMVEAKLVKEVLGK
jgi:NitT/TauT family transport system substrate-binding protein